MARRRKASDSDAGSHQVVPEPEMMELEHDLEAEIDMLNDPSVSHLPEAEEIGGMGYSHARDTFEDSYSSVGRPTSAPMFEHAQAFPQAKQLRVWEVKEGVPHGLGLVGINASEEEFVGRFRAACPGKFLLRPIDINGRYVGQEFTTLISPNHRALQNGSSNGSAAPSFAGSDFLMQMLELQREEMRELRLKMEEERAIIGRERMELAEERTALASNAAMGVQSVAERMMASDQARQDQITSTLTGIFQQQLQMMTVQAEQDRQRHRQRMDEIRQEQTFQMERERDRLASERAKEREHYERREKEARAVQERERDDARMRERLRKAEMDASLQREREHAERMMQMNKTESGMGGVKKVLSEFGMKPTDILDLIRGDNDGGADPGIGATIVKGITEVGKSFADAAKANVEAQAAVQSTQLQAKAQIAQLQALQQMEQGELYEEEYEEVPEAEAPYDGPAYSTQNPEVAAAFSAGPSLNPRPQQRAPQGPQSAPRVNLPLPVLRRARKATRELVEACRGADQSQWEGIITQGIMKETSIIEYVSAASIRRALLESGAEPPFAEALIQAINSSGLVPDSIPRG